MLNRSRRESCQPSAEQLKLLKQLTNEETVQIIGESQPWQIVHVDPFNRCVDVSTSNGLQTFPVTQLHIEGKCGLIVILLFS